MSARRRAAHDRRRTPPPAHVVPGRMPVGEAVRAGRRIEKILVERRTGEELDALLEDARRSGIAIEIADRTRLDEAAGTVRHQGVIALCPSFPYVALEQLLEGDLVVVLDGVTDTRNLGAIARSALQAGAAGMVVRDRRAAGVNAAAEKASAGALTHLPVAKVTNIVRALDSLREAGLWSVGLAGGGRSLYDEPLLAERVALVVGDEGTGISRLVGEHLDATVEIPMRGPLDSLNAATATSVALFEVLRLRHHSV